MNSSVEKVIQSAKKMRFVCKIDSQNVCHIFSTQKGEHWKLSQSEDKWILSHGGVPQIYRSHDEAIAFLESRYRLFNQ
jgi:hypothetical protein